MAEASAEPFRISERDQDGVRVLAVAGELDLATSPALCERLEEREDGRAARVLVDLTRVAFCDSTGLRALLGAAADVRADGGAFALACRPDGDVARLLEVVGARDWLTVYDDAAAALAALRV